MNEIPIYNIRNLKIDNEGDTYSLELDCEYSDGIFPGTKIHISVPRSAIYGSINPDAEREVCIKFTGYWNDNNKNMGVKITKISE